MWCARLDRDPKRDHSHEDLCTRRRRPQHHSLRIATASQQRRAPGDAFTTAAGLKAALKNYSAATAVGIWNSLTGVAPVKRFKDAATAAERIFAELQKLGGPDAEAAPAKTDAPKAKRAPRGDVKPVAARKATKKIAKRSANGPRTTKTAQLIEMLKRPKGATLEEVMAEFGWQVHTTRGIMSAGWLPGKETRDYCDQREGRRLAHLSDREVKHFRLTRAGNLEKREPAFPRWRGTRGRMSRVK
jgi:hypothetical protein